MCLPTLTDGPFRSIVVSYPPECENASFSNLLSTASR